MEWISVKDRLPGKEAEYLCWDVPYSAQTGKPCFGFYWIPEGFETDIAEDWSNVTHWMPLPEPPK